MNSLTELSSLGWLAPKPNPDGVIDLRLSTTEISYPAEGLDLLALEGGSAYWFDHRAAVVSQLLSEFGATRLWEIGSGTGAMAIRLKGNLTDIVTVEPLMAGAVASASQGLTALCGTLEDLDLPDSCLDTIGVFDVLEHISAVKPLLAEIRRVLKPDGLVFVTVPAFQGLWGDEDDVAGHYRRYSKRSLNRELTAAGFTSLKLEYLYASLVAPAWLLRSLPYKFGRRSDPTDVLHRMEKQLFVTPRVDRSIRRVLASERAISSKIPLPLGTSIAGAFRKSSSRGPRMLNAIRDVSGGCR